MFDKGSVIVNQDRNMIFKVLEVDVPQHEYLLKVIYPEQTKLTVVRKDCYLTHCECKKVL